MTPKSLARARGGLVTSLESDLPLFSGVLAHAATAMSHSISTQHMTNFSFWLVEKGSPSQSHTHTVAKQHTLELLPSGTVGDIVQAARGHIPPNLKLSSEDINDLDMQVYAVRQSQHSYLSWF